jgi:hypothetical protein
MANKNKGIYTYTVQEAANAILPRLIKVNPTISATDNDDNDMAFEWVEIPNASLIEGKPVRLISASCWDPGVSIASFELFFCRGSGSSGTAPTTAQGIGVADTAPDITAAEGSAIVICGSLPLTLDNAEGLTAGSVATATNINLIMSPAAKSTSLYVGGVYRSEPADNSSSGNTSMDLYLGFEG